MKRLAEGARRLECGLLPALMVCLTQDLIRELVGGKPPATLMLVLFMIFEISVLVIAGYYRLHD